MDYALSNHPLDPPLNTRVAVLLRYWVGGLLIVAAALKIHAFILNLDKSHRTFPLPVAILYLEVVVEILLGMWLLCEQMTPRAWSFTIAMFGIFTLVTFYQVVVGEDVCGCFGFLSVSPWITLLLDTAVMWALVSIRVRRKSEAESVRIAWASFGSVVVLSIVLLWSGLPLHYDRVVVGAPVPQRAAKGAIADRLALNLPVMFSAIGVRPNYVHKSSAKDLREYLQDLVTAHADQGAITATKLALADLNSEPLNTTFVEPYIAMLGHDRVALVIGVFGDSGEVYYEILDGPSPPYLIRQDDFARSVSVLYRLKARAGKGTTFASDSLSVSISRQVHSFGLQQPDQKLQTEFVLTNVGSTPVDLGTISSSCGCAKGSIANDVSGLGPGESATLVATLALGTESTRQKLSIAVRNSAGQQLVIPVEMLASQTKLSKLSPQTVDFGIINTRVSSTRSVYLAEVATDQCQITDVDTDGLPIKWNVMELRKSGGDLRTFEIKFELDPTELQPGSYVRKLQVKTSSSRKGQLNLECRFQIPGRVEVRPTTLSFGVVSPGDRTVKKVLIRLTSGQPCTLEQAEPSNGPFRILEIVPVNSREYSVSVEHVATEVGPQRSIITINTAADAWRSTISFECGVLVSE